VRNKPKILVARQIGGIGDVLSMSCVYRGLREKFPSASIELVTSPLYGAGALYEIAQHNPFIDKIHHVDPYAGCPERTRMVWGKFYKDCPPLEEFQLWKNADMTFDLNTPCVDYEWEAMHTPEGIQKPRYEIWCDFCEVVPSTYFPVYEFKEGEIEQARALLDSMGLKKPIIVAVNANDEKRAVPKEKLLGVIRILQSRGYEVVTLDGTFKFNDVPGIVGQRFSQVMAIMSLGSVCVSGDSGLLHVAGTVGTPIVGIFGPTDPDMRMKLYQGSAIDGRRFAACSPCWYVYGCLTKGNLLYNPNPAYQITCMKKIPVEIIAAEVERWL
jgi:ADP-heptose:LPS heptosyltransferase